MKKTTRSLFLIAFCIFIMSGCGSGGESAGFLPLPEGPAPSISIADSLAPVYDYELAFGSTQPGAISDGTVTVSNTGTKDLVLGEIAASNVLAAPFSIISNTCSGQTLPPAGSCSLTVRFVPSTSGNFTDSFDIPSNDPSTPTVTFDVTGTGSGGPVPNISVTDSAAPGSDHQLPFGYVVQATTSNLIVTVSNMGTANLVIGSVANANSLALPFSITSDTCSGQTLAAAANCSLTVRFAPTSVNSFTDSFDIPSNDPDTPSISISVSGTGVLTAVPNISVTDTVSPYDDLLMPFGSMAVGTSGYKMATVTNTGTGNLVIGTVANVNPLASPFSFSVDTCSGQTIAPSGTCYLTVWFQAAAVYTFNDSFDIPSNDPDAPTVTVSVTGTGTGTSLANISVRDSVNPDNDLQVSFGNVGTGKTSDQTVTVVNTGTGNLVIGSVASVNPLASPFSITSDGCSNKIIAQGATCVLNVRFTPTSASTFSDSFDIPSSDPDTTSVTVSVAATNATNMGGSIQGNQLTLTKSVTTFAGLSLVGWTDGRGDAAKFYDPGAVATDGTNLYVVDSDNHTIRQVSLATGDVSTLAGTAGMMGGVDSQGAAARFFYPGGIATDGTYLYVADTRNDAIRKIEISSGIVTTFAGTKGDPGTANGSCAAAQFNGPAGLAIDAANLYVADSSSHTIRKIVLATCEVSTLAGLAGPMPESGSTDGTGSYARFNYPKGIATDGTNVYVADTNNHTIRQIVVSTRVVSTLAGTAGSSGSAEGTGADARFNSPRGIATDGTNLYVADSSNHTIRQIVVSSCAVTTFAGTAGSKGNSDGNSTAARFNLPGGMARYGTDLYLADMSNHVIRHIDISTKDVTSIAGAIGSAGSANGTGSAGRFNNPGEIATDGTNLYVADTNNHTIRRIQISSGAVTTLAGIAGSPGSGDSPGPVGFNSPYGITTDGTNVYVADTDNHTIRKIVNLTGEVSSLAGTAGSSGLTDGTGAAARFRNPRGITTDGQNLYVADTNNLRIRKIVISTGEVSTLAGTFSYPYGITTDGTNLFVAETADHMIQKIVLSTGAVSVFAGSTWTFGSKDGTGTAAEFWYPSGITTDGTYLYLADRSNRTIRKIDIASAVVTTVAGLLTPSPPIGSADGIGSAARFNYPRGITTDGISLYVTDTLNNSIREIQ